MVNISTASRVLPHASRVHIISTIFSFAHEHSSRTGAAWGKLNTKHYMLIHYMLYK